MDGSHCPKIACRSLQQHDPGSLALSSTRDRLHMQSSPPPSSSSACQEELPFRKLSLSLSNLAGFKVRNNLLVADGKTCLSHLGRPCVGLEHRHLWCAVYPGSIDAFRREPLLPKAPSGSSVSFGFVRQLCCRDAQACELQVRDSKEQRQSSVFSFLSLFPAI